MDGRVRHEEESTQIYVHRTGVAVMPSPTSTPTPTSLHSIDGMRVAVYDGLLPRSSLTQFNAAVSCASFTRTEVARPDTAIYRHWAAEIDISSMAAMPFSTPTLQAVALFAGRAGYRPYRCYVNAVHFGDMLFTHVDCMPGAGELTALWYICEKWELEWGGETLFYDAREEVAATVRPRPGRLVIFDSELRHVGRPPNRICPLSRHTLAIKFEPAS